MTRWMQGDIGAGHTVTAIYEVTPVGSDAIRNGPLRYAEQPVSDGSDEIGFFKMRYKLPGATESQLIEEPILPGQGAGDRGCPVLICHRRVWPIAAWRGISGRLVL